MAKAKNSEPRYVISVAARMIGVHVQTLRYYERAGVIQPSRSEGNIRLYSQRDIELVLHIRSLMEDLGVNLAGVEVILRMSQRMAEMERELHRLEAEMEERAELPRSNAEGEL
jgi:MerR family transcriptional regulator/heat shock protein HspR